jgi:hypothetical protein
VEETGTILGKVSMRWLYESTAHLKWPEYFDSRPVSYFGRGREFETGSDFVVVRFVGIGVLAVRFDQERLKIGTEHFEPCITTTTSTMVGACVSAQLCRIN